MIRSWDADRPRTSGRSSMAILYSINRKQTPQESPVLTILCWNQCSSHWFRLGVDFPRIVEYLTDNTNRQAGCCIMVLFNQYNDCIVTSLAHWYYWSGPMLSLWPPLADYSCSADTRCLQCMAESHPCTGCSQNTQEFLSRHLEIQSTKDDQCLFWNTDLSWEIE